MYRSCWQDFANYVKHFSETSFFLLMLGSPNYCHRTIYKSFRTHCLRHNISTEYTKIWEKAVFNADKWGHYLFGEFRWKKSSYLMRYWDSRMHTTGYISLKSIIGYFI